jgi:hypothetical protein
MEEIHLPATNLHRFRRQDEYLYVTASGGTGLSAFEFQVISENLKRNATNPKIGLFISFRPIR